MILKIENICYKAEDKIILDDINLSFNNGIYALLGLNGAGKTTLMKILSTYCQPTSGNILYKNVSILQQPQKLQVDLSFMSQNIGLIQDFTVEQNLYYFGLLKGCNAKELKLNIVNTIEQFDLKSFKSTKILNLSGGVKQRIGIALALISSPKILILDEPINNLDHYERERFYFLLKKLSKTCIIILSTHLIDEIENIAKNVIFMRNGKITFCGELQNCLFNISQDIKEEVIEAIDYAQLQEKYQLIKFQLENNLLKIRYFTSKRVETTSPTFEDAFVYYTKYASL